jgi:hypothetical protein
MNYYNRIAGLLLLWSCLLIGTTGGFAASQTMTSAASGITVGIDSTSGSYTVAVASPAWNFSGSLAQALTGVTQSTGSDSVGSYTVLRFGYQQNVAMQGSIRLYQNVPAVVFGVTCLSATTSLGTKFPSCSYPSGLYVQGYMGLWGTYQFSLATIDTTSPAVFFDADANAFLISPASGFMDARMTYSATAITSGMQPWATNFPANYTYSTILVIGHGINAVFDAWGNALTALNGKIRPANDADPMLNKCGYWTDNKSTYYYYPTTASQYDTTLITVKHGFDTSHVTLGYMQLDSWWYPKSSTQQWTKVATAFANGCWVFRADTALFPNGLASFQQSLGLALVTHSRWFAPASPYVTAYKSSYTANWGAMIDTAFWDGQIASYLQQSGVAVYEQDWLDTFAMPAYQLGLGDSFLGNMSRAMQRHGVDIQYCMVLPKHYLQAAKYSNVTSMRISQDGFDLTKRDQICYLSRLTRSVGAYPWTDVFPSSDEQRTLIAVLTAGVVGFSDTIGKQTMQNVLLAVRRDGVIVKPDVPLTPTDETYMAQAASGGNSSTAPMAGVTYSDFGGARILYLFAYYRSGTKPFSVTPAKYGDSGVSVYVYNFVAGTGKAVASGAPYADSVANWNYYIVAPIGPSGIAFLGDQGKFVTCGKKRIVSLSEQANQVSTVVAIEPVTTSVTLFGYAPTQPTAVAGANGRLGTLAYSSTTKLWSVAVSPVNTSRTDTVQIPVAIGYNPVAVRESHPGLSAARPSVRPAGRKITVAMQTPCDFTVQVFDLSGREVDRADVHNQRFVTLSKGLNNPGTFLVKIRSGTMQVTDKIVLPLSP